MTVVFVTVILATSFFGACFYAEYLVMTIYTEFDIPYLSWVVIVIISIAIEWFSIGYIVLSESLTNQENHKTETNYENSLITKTLFFKLFNNYSALIFTAFFKGPFLGTCATSCIYDLQMLLYGIFIVRFLVSIWSMISPYFRKSVQIINGNVKPANVPNGDLRDLHGEEMQVLHSGTYIRSYLQNRRTKYHDNILHVTVGADVFTFHLVIVRDYVTTQHHVDSCVIANSSLHLFISNVTKMARRVLY